jgi:hypothetical protein
MSYVLELENFLRRTELRLRKPGERIARAVTTVVASVQGLVYVGGRRLAAALGKPTRQSGDALEDLVNWAIRDADSALLGSKKALTVMTRDARRLEQRSKEAATLAARARSALEPTEQARDEMLRGTAEHAWLEHEKRATALMDRAAAKRRVIDLCTTRLAVRAREIERAKQSRARLFASRTVAKATLQAEEAVTRVDELRRILDVLEELAGIPTQASRTDEAKKR